MIDSSAVLIENNFPKKGDQHRQRDKYGMQPTQSPWQKSHSRSVPFDQWMFGFRCNIQNLHTKRVRITKLYDISELVLFPREDLVKGYGTRDRLDSYNFFQRTNRVQA